MGWFLRKLPEICHKQSLGNLTENPLFHDECLESSKRIFAKTAEWNLKKQEMLKTELDDL